MNIQQTVLILILCTTSFTWVNCLLPNDHSSDQPSPMLDFNVPELRKKFLNFDLSVPYSVNENIFIYACPLSRSLILLLLLITFLPLH